MRRSYLVIGGVAIIAIAVLLMMFGGGGGSQSKVEGSKSKEQNQQAFAIPKEDEHAMDPEPIVPGEEDPKGTLLMEGQVLGDNDAPVAKADVWISSVPPQHTVSDDDGSFHFDSLLPHEYAVSARSADAIGGPVMVRLGPNTDPVVIRLRDGASLTVHVTAAGEGTPVAGASVELKEIGAAPVKTDEGGVAKFHGLGAGWSVIVVKADGYAEGSTAATIGAGGSASDVSIALEKGAALAGKVVDESGAPIANAMVSLRDAGSVVDFANTSATSGDDGSFAFAAVAGGSYTLSARDGVHAPGASDLLSLDGVTPKRDVTITMKAGATIKGHVVTQDKQPSPYAAVEVAPKMDSRGGVPDAEAASSRVTADAQGNFELKGLPRAAVRVHAENDEAGSQIVDIDLADKPEVDGLELVLDVDGAISGIVVDSKGEPVAEAQVSAFPDVFGADGAPNLDDLQFAGFTSAITDGGGGFRLHGLPDGAYRLWASRTASSQMIFQTEGTPGKTGDKNVKIVLPAPGGLAGHLAFDSGDPPKHAIVSVGVMPATPISDGEIAIHDLPPGKYDVMIRGPEFAEISKRDVEIKEGQTTDLGTITVSKGRQLSGRVVDGAGNGIAGVRVIAGQMLVSQGKGGGFDPSIEEQMGVRSTTTDGEGTFVILGAPVKGGSVMADDPDRGRSDALPFAAGQDDITNLTLSLHGFGSIAGIVTMAGQPQSGVAVTDSSKTSSGQMVVVQTGADGRFVIDKTPEGDHRLAADKVENMQVTSAGADVHVDAGKRSDVTIEIPVGTITLTVTVKGRGGAHIDVAQVFLFRGTVVARNGKEITDRYLAGDAAGMKVWMGGPSFPSFDKLVPGVYSVCTLPINGNIMDPQFAQRLQAHAEDLAVYCANTTLEASPDQQTYTSTVPPMNPLPAD